jgi:hypothetical protein
MPVRGQQPEAEVGAVSVKYERHIGCHTGFAQEILQFGIAYRPIVGVTQVGVGIPEHGAGDVTGLVGSGANVDLDETHGRIIEVGRDPRIVDTRVRQRSYSFHRPASQSGRRNADQHAHAPDFSGGWMRTQRRAYTEFSRRL